MDSASGLWPFWLKLNPPPENSSSLSRRGQHRAPWLSSGYPSLRPQTSTASGRLPKDYVVSDKPRGQDTLTHYSKDTVFTCVATCFRTTSARRTTPTP